MMKQKYLRNKAWLSRDYYLLARKRAKSANIIITNHSLLVTDLSSEQSFLPEYEEAIIDEAHQFVKAAGKHFGFKVDYILLKLLFGRLGTYEQKQLFYQLEQIVNEVDLKKKDLIHSFEINEMITDAVFEVEQFFSTARAYALKGVSSQKSNMKKAAFRFKSENNRESSALLIEAERFYNMIKELISNLRSRINLVMQHQLSAAQKLVLTELETTLNDLEKIINAVDRLFIHPACDFVTWIEIDMRAKDHKTIIYGEPLNVSNVLKDHLFTDKKSVILTSATLTVNNSFKNILNELGLTSFNPSLKQIASPFNYDKQVQLIIPEDLPEINTVNTDEYVSAITEYIISIAEATQGRMLILFTSHEMLKNTHELIKESGFLEDFVLIAQGITSGSRIRLMRNFRRFEKAILFGTSSFWEGVDIPGEDLSCLVIVRLPFSSPKMNH
ncbi:helicase C-terminal domain-containing protein [Bacillus aquiflavi]|uniref:helicase C-terminal domain-containing protein n=1 Tax=Bacillus aquiflavi TaxID=2672567 RepID=UPI0029316EEC|nr:helicase C-terminal domain-containing protein [Bacillus aquiflavi]